MMKRGDDYDSIKMAVGRRMWMQVLAIYPQIADKVGWSVRQFRARFAMRWKCMLYMHRNRRKRRLAGGIL